MNTPHEVLAEGMERHPHFVKEEEQSVQRRAFSGRLGENDEYPRIPRKNAASRCWRTCA